MLLSLHVISKAVFGERMDWPTKEDSTTQHTGKLPNGHTMTFTDALQTLLHQIIFIVAVPHFFLSKAP